MHSSNSSHSLSTPSGYHRETLPPNLFSKESSVHAEPIDLDRLSEVAGAIRSLSLDAIDKASSGHPGLPLGLAEVGAYLYGYFLRICPKDPEWIGRDRLILSAGHGSMWLYSCLHLAGFDLSMDDLKSFRQLDSRTPGHPEFSVVEGIEATTGPLGQGIAQAVGQALALKMAGAQLGSGCAKLLSGKVIAVAGDGCFMEGVSYESMSFAGTQCLDNLIVIYDSNDICLDGPTQECFTEDVEGRAKAMGWQVCTVDGHDMQALDSVMAPLRCEQSKPTLVIAKTIIGYGSPKAGSHKVHGSPIQGSELISTRQQLKLKDSFTVKAAVTRYFDAHRTRQDSVKEAWQRDFLTWQEASPEEAKLLETMLSKGVPAHFYERLNSLNVPSAIASRQSSGAVIGYVASLPYIVGGSADLSCSDNTSIKDGGIVSAQSGYLGRNIKFGVREFAMGSIASGIAQSGFWVPFIGTFLTFSDYMRGAIRLAALMQLQVIYQFTHDSIFLGEDGPTHQPVEHITSLRALPGLQVIRPCDSHEVKNAWRAALNYEGPTALILSRQKLKECATSELSYEESLARGGYLLKREADQLDVVILASGSEVSLALEVAAALQEQGYGTRVVSMPCHEIFDAQDVEYQRSVLGREIEAATDRLTLQPPLRVSIEAGSTLSWYKYLVSGEGAACRSLAIGIDDFGRSAPEKDLRSVYGFTCEAIKARIIERLMGEHSTNM